MHVFQLRKITSVSNNDTDPLSLSICPGRSPFALNPAEILFRPDDWAWQFLRLDKKYQDAYCAQLTDEHRRIGSMLSKDSPLNPSEHYCRNTFGLSTWLNPIETRLPDIGKENSWFFPIKAVADWPEKSGLLSHPSMRFGYQGLELDPDTKELRVDNYGVNVNRASRSVVINFFVNCAVALNAQLKTIEMLCRSYRRRDDHKFQDEFANIRYLSPERNTKRAWAVKETTIAGIICLPEACPWPRQITPNYPAHSEILWRVISIDIHRPVQRQIDLIEPKLREIFATYQANRPARGKWPNTYKCEIQSTSRAQPRPSDGHYLKALVIIKELQSFGYKPDEIDTFFPKQNLQNGKTDIEGDSEVEWEIWLGGRPKRIKQLLEQANDVVNGGYRWLINANKP